MKIKFTLLIILFPAILSVTSCKKVKEYFHDPETEPIAHAIKTSAAIGYAASIAMSVMLDTIFG